MLRIIAKNVERNLRRLVNGNITVFVNNNVIYVTINNGNFCYNWAYLTTAQGFSLGDCSSDRITESFIRDYHKEIRRMFFK